MGCPLFIHTCPNCRPSPDHTTSQLIAHTMLVEELGRQTLQSVSYSSTGSGRKRIATAQDAATQSSTKTRAIARRLNELERENYNDSVKLEPPRDIYSPNNANKKGTALKKILASKKTLQNFFDEDSQGAERFQFVASSTSAYPKRRLCTVCGYKGFCSCVRCGFRYCSKTCEEAHTETRCLKMYA